MKNLIFKGHLEMTKGERQQVFGIGAAAIATEFLALCFILLNQSQYGVSLSDMRFAAAPMVAALGTLFGVYVAMPWLGGRGTVGAARALIGCVVVFFIMIGFSTLAITVMFGIELTFFLSGLLAAEWSILPLLWLVAVWQCHEMCKLRKSERNSIYNPSAAVRERMMETSELNKMAFEGAGDARQRGWVKSETRGWMREF